MRLRAKLLKFLGAAADEMALVVFPELDLVVASLWRRRKPGAEQRRINDAVIAEIMLPGFV